jgi:hypothetical protein
LITQTFAHSATSALRRRRRQWRWRVWRARRRQRDRMFAFRPRSVKISSTSRYDSEYRKYRRTAQRIKTGSLCRHLGSLASLPLRVPSGYQPAQWLCCNVIRKLPPSPMRWLPTAWSLSTCLDLLAFCTSSIGRFTRYSPAGTLRGDSGNNITRYPAPRLGMPAGSLVGERRLCPAPFAANDL